VREDGKRATPPLIAADAHGRVAVVEEKPAAEPGARRDDVKARGTPEEQLAEAERARVLREQEQRDQEQAELQRRSSSEAANQRKLAEQVRDRERHEQVMRDLDKSSRHNARGKVRITMFSTSWCGVCKKARAYMLDKNIPFSEHDIEQDEVAKERARALNPRGGVPTILVDELLLVGFSPGSLEQSIDVAARRYQGS
jgi:glutaredoxin